MPGKPHAVTKSNAPRKQERPAEGMRPRPGGRILSGPDAASHVREMFSRIAPRYDLLNHLLSFSLDRFWRWRVARRFCKLLSGDDCRVVDLCCGTGDLTLALDRVARSKPGGATILGCDFAHPMLVLAQEKTRKVDGATRHGANAGGPQIRAQRRQEFQPAGHDANKERAELVPRLAEGAPEVSLGHSELSISEPGFIEADALQLPFAAETFDLVTSAFGFRNLANYDKGLGEIWRVLKPGGWAAILEFSLPPNRLWRFLFGLYFRFILPRVGTAISGVVGPYQYLPDSVYVFPLREKLVELMESAGFVEATFEEWAGGIVALHTARRGNM